MLALAQALHMLAVVIWVGGMFFAYMALRPAAAELDPHLRLALWARTLKAFFRWVWLSVILIPASGLWMIGQMGGFAAQPRSVHLMLGLGSAMILIYVYVAAVPYRKLAAAVVAQDLPTAAAALAMLRRLVALNLLLGLTTITVAVAGPNWL